MSSQYIHRRTRLRTQSATKQNVIHEKGYYFVRDICGTFARGGTFTREEGGVEGAVRWQGLFCTMGEKRLQEV